MLQQTELRSIFDKVDRSGKGYLDQNGFEVLIMALGYFANENDVAFCFQRVANGDALTFDTFFEWWTSEDGASYFSRK